MQLPAEEIGTTAPIPETGIDPTIEMPNVDENSSSDDSPEA